MDRAETPRQLSLAARLRRAAGGRPVRLVAAALLIGIVVAGDRLGWFGRASDDVTRYDGKSFRVVKAVDGDTLDIEAADWREQKPFTRVRLWGVDTPETQCEPVAHFGPEAARYTQSATLGQTVRLQLYAPRTRGKYRRLLAYVFGPDGRMLNLTLIEQGLGYADCRFDHPRMVDFMAAMKRARRAGVGLWKDATAADLPAYLRDRLGPQPPSPRPAATMAPSTP